MQYRNVSTGMEPNHYAMVPELVEKQIYTEQVRFYLTQNYCCAQKTICLNLKFIDLVFF